MKLLKMFARKDEFAADAVAAQFRPSISSPVTTEKSRSDQASHRQMAQSNVVHLETPLNSPAGLNADLNVSSPEQSSPRQLRGLLDAQELKDFFADNHFGLGRHNGANYRTHAALELGQMAMVSRFQNQIEELIKRRQTKVDRLKDKILETEGLCAITTSRLKEACVCLEREMAELKEQFIFAGEHKGWLLEALNRYQIGFGKGVREAIEFEFLMD